MSHCALNVFYQRKLEDGHMTRDILELVHSFSHLQLSTKALASSNRESGRSAVRQSVMLKKCFSLPMNVDWSHRGASMSNELRAIASVKIQVQIKHQKASQLVFVRDVTQQLQSDPEEKRKKDIITGQSKSWWIVNACSCPPLSWCNINRFLLF